MAELTQTKPALTLQDTVTTVEGKMFANNPLTKVCKLWRGLPQSIITMAAPKGQRRR